MGKYNIFLFNPKINVRSEVLETTDSPKQAIAKVEKLRKQGLAAFFEEIVRKADKGMIRPKAISY